MCKLHEGYNGICFDGVRAVVAWRPLLTQYNSKDTEEHSEEYEEAER